MWAAQRINTNASCHSSRVLPHPAFQRMPFEVATAQSVEVLSFNTSAQLVGFAQQGPVCGAFARMASSSSSQFIKGASRRHAAPGSRCVEVAARAATCPASNERWFSQEKDREGQHRARPAFIGPATRGTRSPRFRRPVVSPGPAQAQRLRPWRATAGVGEIRPRLPRFEYALACEHTPPAASFHQEVGGLRKRTHEPWHEAT